MNKLFLSLPIILGAATCCASSDSDYIERLDAVIVTGTVDSKTAFDLAQGATLLTGGDLRRRLEASLGETLSATPGVNSTYYGPGASRPIIRGLGGDRVRMLEDSVGSLDLSSISPDHNASIEPLLVERIEVLRGPATLLFGSSAVGGVVNVIDNRIPDEAGLRRFSGNIEARFASASNERTGVVAATAESPSLAVQINGLRSISDDVDIPSGSLTGSAISRKNYSVGGTVFGKSGKVGVALSEYDSTYGVPTGDDPPISIDMRQRRIDMKGSVDSPFSPFKALRMRAGFGDYTHRELSGAETVNTTFRNKASEGRIELIQDRIGNLSGTLGMQAMRADFSAEGEEVVTPATLTHGLALFILEEYRFRHLTLQAGGRQEWQRIRLGEVASELPSFDGYTAHTGECRSDRATSASLGAVLYPNNRYSFGVSATASQRLPIAQELYSNGPHGGTAAYEVGNSSLGKEHSLGIDLTVRRRGNWITGSLSLFMNSFDNYIFEQELPADLTPATNNPEGFTAYQFVAKEALFTGAEAEIECHLVDRREERLHLTFTGDYVRAEQTTDNQLLPRIPPLRTGAELRYQKGAWALGVQARYVFRQDRHAELETATSGYALIGADVGFSFGTGRMRHEILACGSNLTDREARMHTSFLKDSAPLPGRNLSLRLLTRF